MTTKKTACTGIAMRRRATPLSCLAGSNIASSIAEVSTHKMHVAEHLPKSRHESQQKT